MPITTVGSDRLIQCPKMVPQNHAHNTLILQVNLCATLLTEKAYFCGRMALWHQITRILSKPRIGTLPFHEERPLVGRRHMAHELRIAEPTIRNDHRRWQGYAASVKSRHAPVYHDLHPAQFVTARRPRACGVGPTDGKVHGHHEFALSNDDHQEDPI